MLKAFSIVILILSLITFGIWSQSDRIRRLISPDIIRVQLYGKLEYQGLQIYWKTEQSIDSTLVYQSGKQLVRDFPVMGYNSFVIYHNSRLVGEAEHFKTNKYNSHSYYYVVEEQNGSIDLTDVVISGIDGHR